MICTHCKKEYTNQRSRFCSSQCSEEYDVLLQHRYQKNTDRLTKLIDPIPFQASNYVTDVDLGRLERTFTMYHYDYGFEYCPDFQRGHVWTRQQQIAYMEAFVRNTLGDSQRTITLNCPVFGRNLKDPVGMSDKMVIVDGLQRATAIIAYMKDEFTIFNGLKASDFDVSAFSLKRKTVKVQILNYHKKTDLLKYYILINSGGVVHSEAEINRVKEMVADLERTPEEVMEFYKGKLVRYNAKAQVGRDWVGYIDKVYSTNGIPDMVSITDHRDGQMARVVLTGIEVVEDNE